MSAETAKAAAETAANNAEQSAGVASDFSQMAEASANSATVYSTNADNAKNKAIDAKEAAESFAGECSVYAANAQSSAEAAAQYMDNCGTILTVAEEVSRIAIIPITGTTQTIQPNKCYTLNTDGGSYTLTPATQATAPEYLLQSMVQITTGATAPTITWAGVEHFFNDKIPTINANSSYNIIYEFDNLRLAWVVGVIKK